MGIIHNLVYPSAMALSVETTLLVVSTSPSMPWLTLAAPVAATVPPGLDPAVAGGAATAAGQGGAPGDRGYPWAVVL